MYVCIHVCMHLCMYVCKSVYVCITNIIKNLHSINNMPSLLKFLTGCNFLYFLNNVFIENVHYGVGIWACIDKNFSLQYSQKAMNGNLLECIGC